MAYCHVCGKIGRFGRNVSHAKNRTPTRWLPNVQRATMTFNGVRKQVKACTRCIRTQYKSVRVK